MMTRELFWLALSVLACALYAFPYVLNRMAVRGIGGALANPRPGDKPLAAWAERAKAAHANGVENLVAFAPAALAVHVLGRGDSLTATACAVYFISRQVHYLAYTAGVPGVRTLAYFGGLGGILVLVFRVLGWL